MIKKNVPVMSIALAATITALVSCSKNKYKNTDQLASLGKATVSGKAYARTVDTSGAAVIQYAPSGTVIKAWIDGRDLVIGDSTGLLFGKRYFTGTVDGSGKYSISIDVSKYRSGLVHIAPVTFEHDVIIKSGKTVKTERRKFKCDEFPYKSMKDGDSDTTAMVYYVN
ncbi:hypothetical protein GCM10023093_31700 [Nemorincola caseinilytica]|uniref:Lipoprotein n=1 Tax=Nemorincola caseinilytica TaxID=2054315 RepID=A0ABP8NT53_9BACT